MESHLLERLNMAEVAGEWWGIPYWRKPCYLGLEGYSETEREEAFLMLQSIYSATWFFRMQREHQNSWTQLIQDTTTPPTAETLRRRPRRKPRHPIFQELSSDGLVPVSYLLLHGRALVLAELKGLLGGYKVRLLDSDNFTGAWFELDILRNLLEAQIEISPAAGGAGNRRCEFLTRNGQEELFLEAKYLFPSRENEIVSRLSNGIHDVLQFGIRNRAKAHIPFFEMLPAFRESLMIKGAVKRFELGWADFAKTIAGHVNQGIDLENWGLRVIPDILQYSLQPIHPDTNFQGQGGGFAYSRDAEVAKIIEHGIEKAAAQLPHDRAGVLVVFSQMGNNFPLYPEDFHTAFQERPALAGLVVVSQVFDGRILKGSQFFRNPGSFVDISAFRVAQVLQGIEVAARD